MEASTPKTDAQSVDFAEGTKKEMTTEDEEKKEFLKDLEEMKAHAKKNYFTSEYQVERIAKSDNINPFEVLDLEANISDAEIKKRFKQLSILLHPDKCKDPRAGEVFDKVKKAQTALLNQDQRKVFQRVMREAKERVESEREKENRQRKLRGLDPLPAETLSSEVQTMVQKLFKEIEDRKQKFERLDNAYRRQRKAEQEMGQAKAEIQKEDFKDWEDKRDDRVSAWKSFQHKTKKREKKIKYKFGTRPPAIKPEKRAEEEIPNADSLFNNTYKKQWR